MKFKDYYHILGVTPSASADEIKAAYRKLARTFHPDVNKAANAQARFVEIGEAYEALGDPEKRAAYERLRAAGFREGQEMDAPPPEARAQRGGASGGFGGGDAFTDIDPEAFSDFFQQMFGQGGGGGAGGRRGGRGRRQVFEERGDDIEHRLAITLEEAYGGGRRRLQMQTPEVDENGAVRAATRTIDVKIPAGVTAGTKIRLRGQGLPGSSPELSGDLYLEVALEPHARFQVDGRDVRLKLPVAPWEAVLGAAVSVPTLGGPVTLKVPAGSRGGDTVRLRGRGLPGEPPGDQLVSFEIAVPASADERERELYRQLGEGSHFDPRAPRA